MKAAEGSLLSSDVFVSSVRTAIGQFILMKSIFHLFISKKSTKKFGNPQKTAYLCAIPKSHNDYGVLGQPTSHS